MIGAEVVEYGLALNIAAQFAKFSGILTLSN